MSSAEFRSSFLSNRDELCYEKESLNYTVHSALLIQNVVASDFSFQNEMVIPKFTS